MTWSSPREYLFPVAPFEHFASRYSHIIQRQVGMSSQTSLISFSYGWQSHRLDDVLQAYGVANNTWLSTPGAYVTSRVHM